MSNHRKQVGSLIIGKLLALIFTVTLPIFLTRILSKEDFGIYSQALVLIAFIPSFFSLGMESNLYYLYPSASKLEKRIYIFQAYISLFFLSLVAALILIIPKARELLIGVGPINNHVSNIILLTITMTPLMIITPLYVLKKDLKMSILYPPSEIILRASLVILSVIIFNQGVNSVLFALNLSSILVFIFVLLYVIRDIKFKKFRQLINFNLFVKQIKYSIPFGLSNSIKTFSQMSDKVICITYLSTTAYANYSIAFYGIPGIMQIYDSLSQVSIVHMSENFQIGNKKEVLRIYSQLVIKTLSFSIPIIFVVVLYAKKIIIFLFTAKYIESTYLFTTYLSTFIIILLGAGLILRATGETKYAFRAYFFSSCITVPTTIFLIKHFGVWGAMCGAIFNIILPKIFMLYKEAKLMECSIKNFLPWLSIFQIAIISLLCLLPFVIIENYIYSLDIITSGFMSIIYLSIVFFIESRFGLFIIDKKQIDYKINIIKIKINTLFCFNGNQNLGM
jgi:O-antigen/teichoic acid export membrane protein